MQQPPLTKRQRQILDYYRQFASDHGLSPTLEEVARHFDLNKVTIFGHVAELERKGLIRRSQKGISRGIFPVDAPVTEERPAGVWIRGRIAAGRPIEALEDLELFDLSQMVPPGSEVYALRVQGDSMIEEGIHDGDLVLVEARKNPQPRDIVVAVLPEGDATLKRYVPLPDGRVRLEPANASMQPVILDSIEVHGVLTGVIRQVRRS
jgi:repressor LexA